MIKSLKSFIDNFTIKIKSSKKIKIICFAILIILFISAFFVQNNTSTTIKQDVNESISTYISSLECKLSQALSKVKGAGQVVVVINVESGRETVLATEKITKETSDGILIEEKPITVNGKTIQIKEKLPQITGVLVVAEGGDKIQIITKIQQAIMSLLDIKLDQIEILTMQ